MSNEKKVEKGNKNFLSGLFRQQIFIPIAALIILAVFNLIVDPSFFKITLGYNSAGDPVLSGYLMTILDYGSELAILAIGMTLVTAASGGQDISVGAAHCHRRQRDLTSTVWYEFQTRYPAGPHYRSISGSLCGSHALRCL